MIWYRRRLLGNILATFLCIDIFSFCFYYCLYWLYVLSFSFISHRKWFFVKLCLFSGAINRDLLLKWSLCIVFGFHSCENFSFPGWSCWQIYISFFLAFILVENTYCPVTLCLVSFFNNSPGSLSFVYSLCFLSWKKYPRSSVSVISCVSFLEGVTVINFVHYIQYVFHRKYLVQCLCL